MNSLNFSIESTSRLSANKEMQRAAAGLLACNTFLVVSSIHVPYSAFKEARQVMAAYWMGCSSIQRGTGSSWPAQSNSLHMRVFTCHRRRTCIRIALRSKINCIVQGSADHQKRSFSVPMFCEVVRSGSNQPAGTQPEPLCGNSKLIRTDCGSGLQPKKRMPGRHVRIS